MLHQHVLQFFDRIEFETGPFDLSFFDPDFRPIVNRHRTVLRQKFKDIYSVLSRLPQAVRTDICNQIRISNNIEAICQGTITPVKIDDSANGIRKVIRTFFLDLYNQVLDGDPFKDAYHTTLREHFDGFSGINKETTLCPICGIGELKKKEDATRDQYDHFLPKALYPFSSVNFENLVPSCKECNSFDAKGEDDTIAVSTGKLFYPFDNSHKGISVEFHIAADNIEPEKVDWIIDFNNPDRKNDEIESWKAIYKIDRRYSGHVKARIDKWYRRCWEHMHDRDIFFLTTKRRKKYYLKSLQREEDLGLAFLRKPALEGFINESVMAKAELEARYYS
jgi:5-methylcytosine-specific restriction endonuclease McrA